MPEGEARSVAFLEPSLSVATEHSFSRPVIVARKAVPSARRKTGEAAATEHVHCCFTSTQTVLGTGNPERPP